MINPPSVDDRMPSTNSKYSGPVAAATSHQTIRAPDAAIAQPDAR